jgi:uncharacterized protein (DUF433 family)
MQGLDRRQRRREGHARPRGSPGTQPGRELVELNPYFSGLRLGATCADRRGRIDLLLRDQLKRVIQGTSLNSSANELNPEVVPCRASIAPKRVYRGRLIFKGTRIAVGDVLQLAADGYSPEFIAKEYRNILKPAAVREALSLTRRGVVKEVSSRRNSAA